MIHEVIQCDSTRDGSLAPRHAGSIPHRRLQVEDLPMVDDILTVSLDLFREAGEQ